MRRLELVHQGRIDALGYVFDPALVGEEQLHRRVLDCLRSEQLRSPKVLQLDGTRVLVLFSRAERVVASEALGLPVVGVSNKVNATPDAGPQQIDSIAWFQGGQRFERALTKLAPVDMTTWLSIDAPLYVCRAFDPPVPPARATQSPVHPNGLREQAGAPPIDPSVEQMINEARAERDRRERGSGGPFGQQGSARGRTAGGMFGAGGIFGEGSVFGDGVLGSALRKMFSGDEKPDDALIKKHEQYLRDLENQFKNGDLMEALRRAIPLGGGVGELMASFGVFGGRNNLNITDGIRSGGVPYGADVHHHLRELYRDAAKHLESEGKFSEAAFVLAELLDDPLAAIAMLERNKLYDMAIDIARKRRLADELITRLLWRGGRRAEAMAWARRTGCHAVVANFLDGQDPEEAFQFRVHWVTDLERSGAYSAAISVGWSNDRVRPYLLNVINKGIAAGGTEALAMHAYRMHLQPSIEHLDDARSAIREHANDPTVLMTLVRGLLEVGAPGADALALDRQLVTTLLRAVLLAKSGLRSREVVAFDHLRERGDGLFRADAARPQIISDAGSSSITSGPPVIPLAPGVTAVFDAVRLNNGCMLVALGEVGAAMVRTNGTVVAKWTQPTHVIVQSDLGNSALLLTQRSSVLDVHVLDIASRKLRRYGTINSSMFARSYDGQTWAAFTEPGLCFFNTHADEPTYDWCELDETLMLHGLSREKHELVAVTTPKSQPQAVEIWRWALPSMNVNERRAVPISSSAAFFGVAQNGYVYVADPRTNTRMATHRVGVGTEIEEVLPGVRSGHCELALAHGANDAFVSHIPHIQGSPIKYFTLPNFAAGGIHALEHELCVFDVEGRVVAFNTSTDKVLAAFSMPTVS